jgi:hypothetical protein
MKFKLRPEKKKKEPVVFSQPVKGSSEERIFQVEGRAYAKA